MVVVFQLSFFEWIVIRSGTVLVFFETFGEIAICGRREKTASRIHIDPHTTHHHHYYAYSFPQPSTHFVIFYDEWLVAYVAFTGTLLSRVSEISRFSRVGLAGVSPIIIIISK